MGVAGAVAAGALAAWLYCRRAGLEIGPVALAAAPAFLAAQNAGRTARIKIFALTMICSTNMATT